MRRLIPTQVRHLAAELQTGQFLEHILQACHPDSFLGHNQIETFPEERDETKVCLVGSRLQPLTDIGASTVHRMSRSCVCRHFMVIAAHHRGRNP